MIIKVHPHTIEIVESEPINEKEVKISKCKFIFDEDMEIPNDYVKEAYFTLNGHTYKKILINDECDYPNEVLAQKGELEIGIVVFKEEDEEYVKLYNPTPVYFATWKGSMKEAQNSVPVTPSDKEQMEQMLANINIDAEKVGRITTITYVNKDGVEHTITLEDGKSIEYDWQGTSLGIRQEGESQYEYVNLKGDKGEPGAISITIVNELPETGRDDTIYLVPYDKIIVQELPTTGIPHTIYIVESTNKRYVYESNQWIEIKKENQYIEYIWINNSWEELGSIGVDVDLSDYYTKEETYSRDETNTLLNGKQNTLTAGSNIAIDDDNTIRAYDVVRTSGADSIYGNKYFAYLPTTNESNTPDSNNQLVHKKYVDTGLSGKQNTIDSSHKLSSDLVDDSSGTNKFVTSEDKTNWNGKVSPTDYATSSTGGVIKATSSAGLSMSSTGVLRGEVITYTNYSSTASYAIISKGTLENVITGKDLTTKAYVDSLVGDVETLLTTLDIGGGISGN